MEIHIRPYEATDLQDLLHIFRSSVQQLGSAYYSEQQITAWSNCFQHIEDFKRWITTSETVVATSVNSSTNKPIAFAGLENSSRIASLYVAPEVVKQGIATKLLKYLLNQAIARSIDTNTHTITAEASEFSKPLFEKYGFEVIEIETNTINDAEISRYRMRCHLNH